MVSAEIEGRLYRLMAAAEDTQKAAEAALVSLGAERVALAQQIEDQKALAEGLEAVLQQLDGAGQRLEGVSGQVGASLVATVREAVARSMQAAATGHHDAVAQATREAIAGAVGERATTLQATTERTVATAKAVEGRLQSAAAGLGWRWMAMAAAGMVAGIAATVGVGYGVGWWQGERIEDQRATIARLAPEVERLEALEARGEELEPAARFLGGLPKDVFGTCGEGVCVMVDERRVFERRETDPEHSAVFMVWGSASEPDG